MTAGAPPPWRTVGVDPRTPLVEQVLLQLSLVVGFGEMYPKGDKHLAQFPLDWHLGLQDFFHAGNIHLQYFVNVVFGKMYFVYIQ